MAIKINTVKLRKIDNSATQPTVVETDNLEEAIVKPRIKIVSRTDEENMPGPDKCTNIISTKEDKDEFHFLQSIIIDNELY